MFKFSNLLGCLWTYWKNLWKLKSKKIEIDWKFGSNRIKCNVFSTIANKFRKSIICETNISHFSFPFLIKVEVNSIPCYEVNITALWRPTAIEQNVYFRSVHKATWKLAAGRRFAWFSIWVLFSSWKSISWLSWFHL